MDKDSIDWVWFDRPHYLFPDDPVGEQAFSVVRDAMRKTKTVAVSRLVLYRRERAVMLEPRDKGIVLWTLRYGEEVRDADPYFGDVAGAAPAPGLMKLATSLIDKGTKRWSPKMVADPVQDRLLEIIASKNTNRPAAKTKPPPKPSAEVIDIMEALRRSLGPKGAARNR